MLHVSVRILQVTPYDTRAKTRGMNSRTPSTVGAKDSSNPFESFAPLGLGSRVTVYPGLAPGATFLRRSAANYSFAKDLATTKGGNNPFEQDGRNVAGYYGPFSPAHHLAITATYAIPGR